MQRPTQPNIAPGGGRDWIFTFLAYFLTFLFELLRRGTIIQDAEASHDSNVSAITEFNRRPPGIPLEVIQREWLGRETISRRENPVNGIGVRYVNPWEIEIEPNPVMFSHLYRGLKPKHFASEPCKAKPELLLPAPVATGGFGQSEPSQEPKPEHSYAALEQIPVVNENLDLGNESEKKYECPKCSIGFRTAGLKNKHINRKHIRRFACSICDTNFHLNADLQRHRKTVHKEVIDFSKCKTWKCENEGCERRELVFTRKDNYERHVARCQNSKS